MITTQKPSAHPRAYAHFARLRGRLVREETLISPAEEPEHEGALPGRARYGPGRVRPPS